MIDATKKEIETRVIGVIARQFGVEEDSVNLESKLIEDLSSDQIGVGGLIMALEEEFDCDISDDEVLKTVRDSVNAILKIKCGVVNG